MFSGTSAVSVMRELWLFGLKQAYASLFGGFLLILIVVSKFWYPLESIHRYDFLFASAVIFQIVLLVFKLESPREALVIIVFHAVATLMEVFKTSDSIGSWHYPEAYYFGVGNVPLFAGFMYSAVGSYIARVWRIFDFQYSCYPRQLYVIFLVVSIYLNFFTHHYIVDLRWVLIAVTAVLFWRTKIHFKVSKNHRYMPILIGWFLVTLFIWLAENIATYSNVWIYPNQSNGWEPVSVAKLSSWYMLMLLSFVLVSLINPVKKYKAKNSSGS
ncbi:MAG: DUF817 domain-containing protein [Porticoccaceae bacterium]|nr:DUF817 domain-containing protein [Porticoccaceae bacterium]